jgi:serine/threonine protein kinase
MGKGLVRQIDVGVVRGITPLHCASNWRDCMQYFEEEHDDIIALNAEMTGIVLASGIVAVENLNRCHRKIDKIRMTGQKPPVLLDCLFQDGMIDESQRKALAKATERSQREKETSQYNIRGYDVLRLLGSGGLGQVVLARQLSMKRLVAIKILHDKWGKDEEFRSRFLLEARVVGRLSHQNLIQVYDVGREDNFYYFCMEYVDGSTLERRMRDGGPMPLKQALGIAMQVAQALAYIASYDIVHRDIKPANIMLTQNNVVKLGDFGFLYSKHEKALKSAGYVVGTPDYISPEQASGNPVDFRSDIYSLGVCLYQMLTGDLPYSGTVSSVMLQHVVADLPERKGVNGHLIDAKVYSMICKMMAKNPSDRYCSMGELINDLQLFEAAELMRMNGRLPSEPTPVEKAEQLPLISASELLALRQQLKWLFYAVVVLLLIIIGESFYLMWI